MSNNEHIVVYSSRGEKKAINQNTINSTNESEPHIKKNIIKYIIGGIVLIVIVVIISVVFCIPGSSNSPTSPNSNDILVDGNRDNNDSDINQNNTNIYSKSKKLESEFKFNTKVHDLKKIFVHQKTIEEIMIDNNITRIFLDRKTIYYLYIISESEPNEDEFNYYNKMYTIAITIAGECFSRENENCVPKQLLDLTNTDNNEEDNNSEEINDLKDIPLPLCLFNITNKDIITSITCHKLIPENKIRMIVLDLYFFRPSILKRLNKEESNNTISYTNLDNNKKLIRETKGGICDIQHPYNSLCISDLNITVDSESNLLEYDEVNYMIVKNDENNLYEKNKITKLIDETTKMRSFNYEKYEQSLNKLLPKLEPHFKTNILFSKKDYEEANITSKEGIDNLKEQLKFRK